MCIRDSPSKINYEAKPICVPTLRKLCLKLCLKLILLMKCSTGAARTFRFPYLAYQWSGWRKRLQRAGKKKEMRSWSASDMASLSMECKWHCIIVHLCVGADLAALTVSTWSTVKKNMQLVQVTQSLSHCMFVPIHAEAHEALWRNNIPVTCTLP